MPSCEAAKRGLDYRAAPIFPYNPNVKGVKREPCHACANATYYVYMYGCGVDNPALLVQTRVKFTPVKEEQCYSKGDEFMEGVTKYFVAPFAALPLLLWAFMRGGQFVVSCWSILRFSLCNGNGGCGCFADATRYLCQKFTRGCLGRKRYVRGTSCSSS
jgi:hypothetical protein